MAQTRSAVAQKIGRGLVLGMPKLLTFLSVVGTAAMIWVGGHILLVGADELGWHWPLKTVHSLEEKVHGASGIGGILAWFANTIASAILGLAVGFVVIAMLKRLPFGRKPAPKIQSDRGGQSDHGDDSDHSDHSDHGDDSDLDGH